MWGSFTCLFYQHVINIWYPFPWFQVFTGYAELKNGIDRSKTAHIQSASDFQNKLIFQIQTILTQTGRWQNVLSNQICSEFALSICFTDLYFQVESVTILVKLIDMVDSLWESSQVRPFSSDRHGVHTRVNSINLQY